MAMSAHAMAAASPSKRASNRRIVVLARRAAGVAALVLVASTAHAQSAPEPLTQRHPDLSQVFVFFFLMLGPIKIIAPFARMTKELDDAGRRRLATTACLIASASTVVAALIGHSVLQNWHVSLGALLLAGGIVLFLVALAQVLQQYAPSSDAAPLADGSGPAADAARIAFPTVVTPYGIAVVIIILATSPRATYAIAVIAILLGVMVLNLLAMLFARQILGTIGIVPLQILGAVLSVLQVALGVQMILWAMAILGIVEGPRF
jgi:multiple antibiotic resistance protein